MSYVLFNNIYLCLLFFQCTRAIPTDASEENRGGRPAITIGE